MAVFSDSLNPSSRFVTASIDFVPCPNQDSSGGKTGSTKSGSGPLDFFGGSSSQSSLPSAGSNQPSLSLATIKNPLVFVKGECQ